MHTTQVSKQHIELYDIISAEGVTFDPDQLILKGCYADELSAHRARKLWIETLSANFLLDKDYDYSIQISSSPEANVFLLSCNFITACACYAFWRITNNQAPEAQYVIETAHIPMCASRHEDILRAPDLRPVHEESMLYSGKYSYRRDSGLFKILKAVGKGLQNLIASK